MKTRYYTIDEICKELKIGKSTAYKWVREKRIKSTRVGRRIIVSETALDDFLMKSMAQ